MKRIIQSLIRGCAGAALMLSACSPPPPVSPQARADQALREACRERANEIFLQQNRGAIYQTNNDLSPFSSSYTPGVTTRGLGEEYGRDQTMDDCIRNKGTQTDADIGAPAAPSPSGASGPASK